MRWYLIVWKYIGGWKNWFIYAVHLVEIMQLEPRCDASGVLTVTMEMEKARGCAAYAIYAQGI